MDTLCDSMARINLDCMMRREVDSLKISLSFGIQAGQGRVMCGYTHVNYTYNRNEMTVLRRLSLGNSRGSDAGSLLEGCVDVRTNIHCYFLRPGPPLPVRASGRAFAGSFCGQC